MSREKKIKKIIKEAKEQREPAAGCDHRWQQTGFWDGTDKNGNKEDKDGWIGGPSAKCLRCGGKKFFRWPEWDALPKGKKIELKGRKPIR